MLSIPSGGGGESIFTSNIMNIINLTTTPTTTTLNDVSYPVINRTPVAANLELTTLSGGDNSGGANHPDGAQNIEVSSNGTTGWITAISLQNWSFVCLGNGRGMWGQSIFGTQDISSVLNLGAGGTLYVRWKDAKAAGNNLSIEGIQLKLHLIF